MIAYLFLFFTLSIGLSLNLIQLLDIYYAKRFHTLQLMLSQNYGHNHNCFQLNLKDLLFNPISIILPVKINHMTTNRQVSNISDIYSAFHNALETVTVPADDVELNQLKQFLWEEYGDLPASQIEFQAILGDFVHVVLASNNTSETDTRETSIDGASGLVSPPTEYSESDYNVAGGVLISELPDVECIVPETATMSAISYCQWLDMAYDAYDDPLMYKYGIVDQNGTHVCISHHDWGRLMRLPRCIGLEDIVELNHQLLNGPYKQVVNEPLDRRRLLTSIWQKVKLHKKHI